MLFLLSQFTWLRTGYWEHGYDVDRFYPLLAGKPVASGQYFFLVTKGFVLGRGDS